MIPQSQDSKEISQNPVIVSIKGALDTLDDLKNQRSKILEEGVQKCQNHNTVEDLMTVYTGQAEKGTIFEKHLGEFKQVYSELETLEKKRAETQSVITSNMGAFSQLVSASQGDTAKT